MDDRSEYDDPAAYDAETHEFDPEGPFYLALAQEAGGPVLELGCGTGRFTIPLARAGVDITGLDVAAPMLERARQKAGDLPIEWIQADARDYTLGRRFHLVFESGATFEHMLTRADQLAFLARAREHLEPDGRLVVAVLTPTADLMADEEGEYPWFTYADDDGQEVQVSGWQTYDPATQVRTETAVRRWTDAAGQTHERRTPLRLRLTFAGELETLLLEAGLEEVARYGGFDHSPWTAESRFFILMARPRAEQQGQEVDSMATSELEAYRQRREALLATIVTTLAADERAVAAWLTGSYARGDADAVSDIDLTVVVADDYAATLCQREEMVTAWPSTERMQLFMRFGQPANVHENNHNAPEGGTFTSILYQPSAHVVDWILVPYALARRPDSARVLFEHRSVAPAPPPEPLEPAALAARVSEQIAFFWMMMAVVAKYLVRGDLGLVGCWLDELSLLALDVENQLTGRQRQYQRNSIRRLPPGTSAGEMAVAMTDLCGKVEEVMTMAGRMGITLRPAPREAIEALLRLLPEAHPPHELEELMAQVTPMNIQAEVDWGAPVGREAW